MTSDEPERLDDLDGPPLPEPPGDAFEDLDLNDCNDWEFQP
jgi:hypothetical protein